MVCYISPDSLGHGIAIVLVFQFLPPFVFLLVDRVLGRFAVWLRLIVYAVLILVIIRLIQRYYFNLPGVLYEVKYLIAAGAVTVAVAAAWLLIRYQSFLYFLGVLSLLLPIGYLLRVEPAKPVVASAQSPRAPIVIVLFDELSLEILLDDAGNIDRVAYPNLAAFAADAIWFRKASANYAFTGNSVVSMFSGDYVRPGNACDFRYWRNSTDGSCVLFTALARNGITPSARRNDSVGEHLRVEFGRLLTVPVPRSISFAFPWAYQYNVAIEIDSLLSETLLDNNIYYYHMMLTHSPYVNQPDGSWSSDPNNVFHIGADMERVRQRYRANTQYADKVLGLFVGKLKTEGLYDRALIIFTSDHGECWTSDCPGRESLSGTKQIPGSLARVPMMIRGPRLKPAIDDGDYQHIDFTPTLMSAAGLPVDISMVGRSALNRNHDGPPRRVLFSINGDINDQIDVTEKLRGEVK